MSDTFGMPHQNTMNTESIDVANVRYAFQFPLYRRSAVFVTIVLATSSVTG